MRAFQLADRIAPHRTHSADVEEAIVRNPRVFGSVIHHSDGENSDLELLVAPLPGTTLFDLGAMQVELETMLGIPVEVLTPRDLPKRFREQVIREAMPV